MATTRTRTLLAAALALAMGPSPGCFAPRRSGNHAQPPCLRILVMDPLAAPLACACVGGYAQRKYEHLAAFLEHRLETPVQLVFGEGLQAADKLGGPPDLVIGKWSVVRFDAARRRMGLRPIALLTDKQGDTTLRGVFVVRSDDPAKTIADLKGRSILFGPEEAAEKHAAALAALDEQGVPLPAKLLTRPSCTTAGVAVTEKEADAAAISSYALALLEGCGSIEKGSLRVVGTTAPVPFVAVFAGEGVSPQAERAILDDLLAVGAEPALLAALESKDGFVKLPPLAESWADWRGPRRDGLSPSVPAALPSQKRLLWMQPLAGPALSGVAVAGHNVLVADKSPDGKSDVFRCLDAESGTPLWSLSYPAEGEMDFTNCPRAMPVVCDGLAYLLGAFGHLHCVKLDTGEVVWKRHLAADFGAKRPTWGYAATPLAVDDLLIVNPGAKGASLVALNRRTGKVVWKSPGRSAAYSSFILATFGGVRQIVGYDATSLGGWDPKTGRRLWELVPPVEGDYNVPTPIALGDKLLVATENNGTRLYAFGPGGAIRPQPVAANAGLEPDSSTPVVVDGLVFGCSGRLTCLDAASLKKLWDAADKAAYDDHATLIGGQGRVLVATVQGELILVQASRGRYEVVSRLRLFENAEMWAHPALVGNRLYLRTRSALLCVLLGAEGIRPLRNRS